ncbi:MAG: DNA topoisomerase (ATP-hydrolyzing) [Lachnospiraceae bacterium]|jgi:DNA gyrase subunit A|nr:DNA topoisomerase (ATP-hydrolyzing) [Lachnospiraceae bacterium]
MSSDTSSVIQLDFSEEMKNSYRDYALSVIIARALPDVRDGLKPVQRRVLYAMHELGLDPDKPHRKSARIVGDTMGKYHPHGDSSIYEALVHMSESYTMQLPLVDGHGNFGSIDGDSAAAMRYTEARLSKPAVSMLSDLDKDVVDFVPNFDESEKEPVVLPAKLPNLLINGTTGIAVGMATNIPTHNPREVLDAVIAYMDNKDIDTKGLMEYIKGPDFPTGGVIVNADELENIYETGEGKIRIRANAVFEQGDAGRTNIVITEIPFTSSGRKSTLVEKLVDLQKDKVFDEIYDVRDESSKEGIRIVIEVKKGRDAHNLLNGLYQKTPLLDTYSVNLLAVKNKQPVKLSLKSMISEFVSFQEEIYTKKYRYQLEKDEKKLEITDGLIKATDVIDLIIEVLRGSEDLAQAKGCLTEGITDGINFKSDESRIEASAFDFTPAQADAILSMQLSRLIGLEVMKLHQEKDHLIENIAEYNLYLSSTRELDKTIKRELREVKKILKTERKTALMVETPDSYVEKVVNEDLYLFIDRFGYTKCIDEASFSKIDDETRKAYNHVIKIKNTDSLCIFTDKANMYSIKVKDIPKCRIKDKGVLFHNLCRIGDEDPVLFIPFEELFESELLFVTKNGYIKRVSGVEFDSSRSVLVASKLEGDDSILYIRALSTADVIIGCLNVFLVSENGMGLAFPLEEVSEYKKTSRGVIAMKLSEDDHVKYAAVAGPMDEMVALGGKQVKTQRFSIGKRANKGSKMRI